MNLPVQEHAHEQPLFPMHFQCFPPESSLRAGPVPRCDERDPGIRFRRRHSGQRPCAAGKRRDGVDHASRQAQVVGLAGDQGGLGLAVGRGLGRIVVNTNVTTAGVLYLASRIEDELGNDRGRTEYEDQLLREFPTSPEAKRVLGTG